MELAARMDVEATALGHYTDSGFFDVRYNDRPVASLPMEFMHDGVPQLELEAVWEAPKVEDIRVDMPDSEQGAFLRRMLNRLNICSKEYIIRQYDHEVRGGSASSPCAASRTMVLPTPASSVRCWNPMPVWSSPTVSAPSSATTTPTG